MSWALADPDTDALIGAVGIDDLTDDLAYGEIGYWTHPDVRGRGVMTTAVGLVLEHAFEVLGLQRVKAYVATGNAASRHVLEASGLTEQGVERLGTVRPTVGPTPSSTTSCVRSGHAGRERPGR